MALALGASVVAQTSAPLKPWSLWGQVYASAFGQWSIPSQTMVPAPGTYTLSLQTAAPPVLPGGQQFQPLATNAPLLVDPGPTQEVVTPTAVNCSFGEGYCTVAVTLSRAHNYLFRVTSATGGLQEAINYQHGNGGTVVLDRSWAGTTAQLLAASGYSNVGVRDDRGAQVSWYAWTGTAYSPVFAVSNGVSASNPAITPNSIGAVVYADTYGSINAAVAAIGAAPVTLSCGQFTSGTTTLALTANLSIPPNVSIFLGPHCQIADSTSAYTLTINGAMLDGNYRIFNFTHGGEALVGGSNVLNPVWWGADPTGAADSTAAFQAALRSAQGRYGTYTSSRQIVVPAGTYTISGNLPFHLVSGNSMTSLKGSGRQNTVLNWTYQSTPLTPTSAVMTSGVAVFTVSSTTGYAAAQPLASFTSNAADGFVSVSCTWDQDWIITAVTATTITATSPSNTCTNTAAVPGDMKLSNAWMFWNWEPTSGTLQHFSIRAMTIEGASSPGGYGTGFDFAGMTTASEPIEAYNSQIRGFGTVWEVGTDTTGGGSGWTANNDTLRDNMIGFNILNSQAIPDAALTADFCTADEAGAAIFRVAGNGGFGGTTNGYYCDYSGDSIFDYDGSFGGGQSNNLVVSGAHFEVYGGSATTGAVVADESAGAYHSLTFMGIDTVTQSTSSSWVWGTINAQTQWTFIGGLAPPSNSVDANTNINAGLEGNGNFPPQIAIYNSRVGSDNPYGILNTVTGAGSNGYDHPVVFAVGAVGLGIFGQEKVAGTTAGNAYWTLVGAYTNTQKHIRVVLSGYENTTATAQTIPIPMAYWQTSAVITEFGTCTGIALGGTIAAPVITLPSSMSATQNGTCSIVGY
ncbi:MAG: hypothetical protein ACRD1Y_13045 [Terriglobales bacterium]